MVNSIRPDPVDPLGQQKVILLNPGTRHDDKQTWSEAIHTLYEHGDIHLIPYLLEIDYKNWSASDILGAVLPEDLQDDLPTGFSPVGHVAHFNLREKYLPYKQIIAQVTMDKNPTITTVINKTELLHSQNQFRILDYEVLAGEPNLDVEVHQGGSVFRFNYGRVFWNSRLDTEHQRLVNKFQPGEAVCDVMAGVGPFAIPAGKKRVFVWANDLNPNCYQGLLDSIVLNKVRPYVRPFNKDGHSFIRSASKELLESHITARTPLKISRHEAVERGILPSKRYREEVAPKYFSHFIMNLPAIAVEFLPDFVGLYQGQESIFYSQGGAKLPLIHCYCFGPKSDDEEKDREVANSDIWETIEAKLKCQIDRQDSDTELSDVRDVAPNKSQYCATFRLPADVAFRRDSP